MISPRRREFLKVLLSAFLGLFSLPMLIYGGYLLVCLVRIHATDVYYSDYHYGIVGLKLIAIGVLNLRISLYAVWRRSFYGVLFAVPALVGFAAMVQIPNMGPRLYALAADSNLLSVTTRSLRTWYEKNGRFPANESELRSALEQGSTASDYPTGRFLTSNYKRRGIPLAYEIEVANPASGPRLEGLSQRPGVIYYCVSGDLQEFWVTMTALQSGLGSTASLKPIHPLPPAQENVIHEAGSDYRSTR